MAVPREKVKKSLITYFCNTWRRQRRLRSNFQNAIWRQIHKVHATTDFICQKVTARLLVNRLITASYFADMSGFHPDILGLEERQALGGEYAGSLPGVVPQPGSRSKAPCQKVWGRSPRSWKLFAAYVANYDRPSMSRPLYFAALIIFSSFFLLFSSPILSAIADWTSAILPHMMRP